MDATEKACVFGQLPWYDQGLPVLVVGEKGEEHLVVTPRAAPEENEESTEWKVDLLTSGAASVAGRTRLRGATAAELREQLLSASAYERRLWLETFLAKRCSGVRVDTFEVTGMQPVAEPLLVSYAFHTPFFGTQRDSAIVIHPGTITATDLPDYFRSLTRKHPIRFRFGMRQELDLTVTLPKGWEEQNIRFSDSVSSDIGYGRWTWQSKGNQFQARSSLLLQGNDVSSKDYPIFQKFLDAVRERDLREVVLGKASSR